MCRNNNIYSSLKFFETSFRLFPHASARFLVPHVRCLQVSPWRKWFIFYREKWDYLEMISKSKHSRARRDAKTDYDWWKNIELKTTDRTWHARLESCENPFVLSWIWDSIPARIDRSFEQQTHWDKMRWLGHNIALRIADSAARVCNGELRL